jgi:kynurenine formamidase
MAERCVQGRAVMIDLHAHVGNQRVNVDYNVLNEILNKDSITIERGDMVCLHTGFAELLLGMNRQPDEAILAHSCSVLEGRDPKLLEWISDSGLSVIIADNYAVEAHPASHHSGSCATLPLHEHCLFKLGIHLGELWHLTPLANWLRAHQRSRFLLTAPPLRLPGAVGSPVAPIATVSLNVYYHVDAAELAREGAGHNPALTRNANGRLVARRVDLYRARSCGGFKLFVECAQAYIGIFGSCVKPLEGISQFFHLPL